MEWFRVNSGFCLHPKIRRLAVTLGVSEHQALSTVVRLWCFVAQSRDDGNLDTADINEISDWCQWDLEPEKLLASLIKSRLVDRTPNGLQVHDWIKLQGPFLSAKDRQKAWREKHRNITETSPLHNATVYRQTDRQTNYPPNPPSRGESKSTSPRLSKMHPDALRAILRDCRSRLSADPSDEAARALAGRVRSQLAIREAQDELAGRKTDAKPVDGQQNGE